MPLWVGGVVDRAPAIALVILGQLRMIFFAFLNLKM
jgi:hypothetical protein